VGIRKPNPKIYLMALEQLQVEPSEAVFLDDLGKGRYGCDFVGITQQYLTSCVYVYVYVCVLGVNLKAARKLGMYTIKVGQRHNAHIEALKELEELLGFDLQIEVPSLTASHVNSRSTQVHLRSRL